MKCAARLPNDGSVAFPLSALAWCVAFLQRRLRGLPPRPAKRVCLACESLVPCLPLRLSGRSRSKVCSSALVRASRHPTDSPRMTGATRAARQHPSGRLRRCPSGSAYSQNRARRFSAKQARRKSAALGFPRGALRPLRFARALDLWSARLPSESPRCGSSTAHFRRASPPIQ